MRRAKGKKLGGLQQKKREQENKEEISRKEPNTEDERERGDGGVKIKGKNRQKTEKN
jgi:hypothetical protein